MREPGLLHRTRSSGAGAGSLGVTIVGRWGHSRMAAGRRKVTGERRSSQRAVCVQQNQKDKFLVSTQHGVGRGWRARLPVRAWRLPLSIQAGATSLVLSARGFSDPRPCCAPPSQVNVCIESCLDPRRTSCPYIIYSHSQHPRRHSLSRPTQLSLAHLILALNGKREPRQKAQDGRSPHWHAQVRFHRPI